MTTGPRPTRSWLLSVGLLVTLLAGTASATLVLRNLVRDQNGRLLHQQTAEAGLVVSSAVEAARPSLQVLAATYAADPKSPVASTLTHGYAATAGGVIAIVSEEQHQLVAHVAAGPDITAGQPLTGARAALARRAITAKDLVSSVTTHDGRKTVLAFAVALPNGIVAYEEIKIDPKQLTESRGNSPFDELHAAIYVAPTADPSELLYSTSAQLPLHGTVAKQVLDIGADRWLLVTSARRSLVGSFTENIPWIVFALGIAASIAAFAAVEILLRRRAYALALVEERTATLRQTMGELDAARVHAEAANDAKSEFLSRMSHELRTPLNAVLGFGQVLELGDLTESQQQSVTQILKGGQHLLELINDVLDISRIETGNLTLSAEPVAVDDIVDDVLDLIEPLAAQQGIRCSTTRVDDESCYVLADRQRLKQILLNLLANAVKYNNTGGTVTISYDRPSDARLRIKITDTGPGIPPDRRDLLFEPFERLGAEQTPVEGAGIGLALSRRLAQAMKGVLDVDSTEGQGSTFWIELPTTEGPVERHERTTAGRSIAPPEASPDSPRHTILYIEDNLANIKLIEQVLEYRHDIHLITAMQGRLGIELALQHQPELILLDLHLPDIGGETVLTEIRAHTDTANVPIIVMTADATERQHARLLAAGATAYLTKPIDVRQLLEIIEHNLSKPPTPQPEQRTKERSLATTD